MSYAPERTWQVAVGRLFTARRDELDIPNHEIAYRARQRGVTISPDVVGRIMRGERANPQLPELAAIAHALGIEESEWIKVALSQGGSSPTGCIGYTHPDQPLLPHLMETEHTLLAAA